ASLQRVPGCKKSSRPRLTFSRHSACLRTRRVAPPLLALRARGGSVPSATPSTSIVRAHSGLISRTAGRAARHAALIGVIVTLSAMLSAVSAGASGKLLSISLSPTKRAIGIGQTVSCHAVGHFSSDTTQDMTNTVTWTSSNPAVVSIDATGKAKGLAFGSATMHAVDPATGIASTTGGVIAVVAAPKSLKISPASVIVALGGATTL